MHTARLEIGIDAHQVSPWIATHVVNWQSCLFPLQSGRWRPKNIHKRTVVEWLVRNFNRHHMAHFIGFVLQALERNATKPFMRPFEGTPSTYAWGLITYQDFLDALRTATAYWTDTLTTRGVKRGDVVGMWYVNVCTVRILRDFESDSRFPQAKGFALVGPR